MQEFEQLLITPPYQEVRQMQATWYEQGLEQGLQRGLEKTRRILQSQLEERFGPLSTAAQEKLNSWPEDHLEELARAFVRAQSLQELDLED